MFINQYSLDSNCIPENPTIKAPYFVIINGKRNIDCAMICFTTKRCVSFTIKKNDKCMLYSHGGGDFCLKPYPQRRKRLN